MGWFKNLTAAVARLDRATNPIHKAVQNQITNKVFDGNQEAALNTGHSIGVGVLDYFFPGLGSALNATDQYQDGNYKGGNRSLISAGFQSYASGSYSSSSPSTTPGYSSGDLGSGITMGSGTTGAGMAAGTGSGITGSLTTASSFAMASDAVNSVNTLDSAVVGFTDTDLGAGITTAEAQRVGATNLTVKDVRSNTTFKAVGSAALKLYDLTTRDGAVLATFGAGQMELPQSSINYLFSAPNNLGAIPSNRAADISAAAAANQAQAAAQKQQALVLAIGCGVLLYYFGAK